MVEGLSQMYDEYLSLHTCIKVAAAFNEGTIGDIALALAADTRDLGLLLANNVGTMMGDQGFMDMVTEYAVRTHDLFLAFSSKMSSYSLKIKPEHQEAIGIALSSLRIKHNDLITALDQAGIEYQRQYYWFQPINDQAASEQRLA